MITAFRRYLDTWYVRAFFLLMVASFVLWGVGDMLRGIGTTSWAAKVGGQTIEQHTLEGEYRRALAAASRNLPAGQEPSAGLRRDAADQALQHLIGQVAMDQTLRDQHIVVPDPAVVDAIHALPMLRTPDGAFDKARFESVLRGNNMTEAAFVALVREDLGQRQLLDAVTAGARASDAEVTPIFQGQLEKRSADIAAFPIAAIAEPPVPDEPTARRWYDNHPDFYRTPEYRRVKIALLSPQTLAPEIGVTEKDVRDAYDQHIAEFTTLARRSAEVISVQDEAQARALADQWRAGADWTAMQAAAKAAGAAAITQPNATEKQFPDPDLAKAVFSLPVNEVSAPVKGVLGWFVVRVTEATAGSVKPFEEVQQKLRGRLVTEKALDLVYDRANKIDEAIANGTSLDALPADLHVVTVDVTLDQQGNAVDGSPVVIPAESELRAGAIAAAFQTAKGDPPHLTEVQTPSTGGSGYYALVLEDIIPAGQKPFEAVRDAVATDWRTDQRRHAAETEAAAMLKAVKDGKSFSDAARDAGVVPHLTPPITRNMQDPQLPPEVPRVLFSLKKDEPTMLEAPDGFLVMVPVEIIPADPAKETVQYGQLTTAIQKSVSDDLSSVFTEALRQRANPRINQAIVDQLVQP